MNTPKNAYSFKIDLLGTDTGKKYKGSFVYTRPTIGKKRDIAYEEALLNSQYEKKPVPEILAANYAIAYLKVCLSKCPKWFEECNYGIDLEDENIIDEISGKIREYEEDRQSKLKKILEKEVKKEENE